MSALVAVKKIREKLRLIRVNPDDYPGFTPWLLERVAHIAHYWLCGGYR